MKKIILCLSAFCIMMPALAKCPCGHNHSSSHPCPHHSAIHHNSSSTPNYLVNTEHKKERVDFPDCKKHYAIVETRTDYYSNGQKNIYKNSTLYNSDDSVLISDIQDFEHFIYNKEHYFIIRKQGKSQIYNTSAKVISKRDYSGLKFVKDDKILAKSDKKFGIIDLKENIIVPVKYQKLLRIGNDIFITKLNRYWGLIDINNKVILKNDCEKIKENGNYILVKRYGKYGLYNYKADKILDINYDKIKILNGYIIFKQNNLFGAINIEDNKIYEPKYDKIKLIRNQAYGFIGKEKVLLFEM